jgi:ATP-dependent Lon protease
VFKTLLSLEKDGYIRIKGIGNGLSGGADNWKFLTKWDNKDYPFVKIEITKRKEIEEDISLSKKSSVNIKIENGIGYFKFHKQGENIKIGGTKTRHFRLLRFLCSPINSAKTVESVFDAIKLPKDKNDSMLNDYNPQQSFRRKLNLIQYTIKELQKNKKIQRKLKFDFNENQKTYRIEIV